MIWARWAWYIPFNLRVVVIFQVHVTITNGLVGSSLVKGVG
jgi:hypothetical protein